MIFRVYSVSVLAMSGKLDSHQLPLLVMACYDHFESQVYFHQDVMVLHPLPAAITITATATQYQQEGCMFKLH